MLYAGDVVRLRDQRRWTSATTSGDVEAAASGQKYSGRFLLTGYPCEPQQAFIKQTSVHHNSSRSVQTVIR